MSWYWAIVWRLERSVDLLRTDLIVLHFDGPFQVGTDWWNEWNRILEMDENLIISVWLKLGKIFLASRNNWSNWKRRRVEWKGVAKDKWRYAQIFRWFLLSKADFQVKAVLGWPQIDLVASFVHFHPAFSFSSARFCFWPICKRILWSWLNSAWWVGAGS